MKRVLLVALLLCAGCGEPETIKYTKGAAGATKTVGSWQYNSGESVNVHSFQVDEIEIHGRRYLVASFSHGVSIIEEKEPLPEKPVESQVSPTKP